MGEEGCGKVCGQLHSASLLLIFGRHWHWSGQPHQGRGGMEMGFPAGGARLRQTGPGKAPLVSGEELRTSWSWLWPMFVKVARSLKKKGVGSLPRHTSQATSPRTAGGGGVLDPVNVTSSLLHSPVFCWWEEVRTHWPEPRQAELAPCLVAPSPRGAAPSPAPELG